MKIEQIDAQHAYASLDAYDVIDVRSRLEYEGPLGRLAGARLLPLPELEERAAELSWRRPALFVCRSGARSARACQWLEEHGFGPVVNLEGGMIEWNRAGLPVERTRHDDAPALLQSITDWYRLASGEGPTEADERIAGLLRAEGASPESPTRGAVERLLAGLEELLQRRESVPADLDIAMKTYRQALSSLSVVVLALILR